MKHTLYSLIFLLLCCFAGTTLRAQVNCANAAPFCTGVTGTTFPAGQNSSAEAGPAYGCLGSQPNPAWYYMQAATSGSLVINISGTGGGDVDFIVWGPFSSATGNCGNLTVANTIDCSFSAAANETAVIPNAVAGQFFMLLLTNYSNQAQNIQFGLDPSSTASTNCDILSTSVNSQTICPGATATLSVTTNLSNPTFNWVPGGSTAQSISVSPGTTTVYTVTVAGTSTASATYTTMVKTGTVTIAPLPTVTMSNTGPYCPGTNGVLNATTNGVASYTWTGPGYNSTSVPGSVSIPNMQPANAGVYTVMVRSSLGCINSTTTQVAVIPTSTIAVAPPITICQGATFSLTANAPGATTYNWTGPSGFNVPGVQNPVVSNGMPNQTGTYTVTALFVSGTRTCTTKNTTPVVVIPNIPINPAQVPSICYNGDINLNGVGGADTYTWTGPASYVSNSQNAVIHGATETNEGLYMIQATTNGCTNTGTVNIDVFAPLSIASISQNTVICNSKQTVISGSGSGGSGTYLYEWSPASSLSDPYNPVTTASPSATQEYTLTIGDANCAITPTINASVTVSVNPIPVITFTTPDNEGCEPFTTSITLQSVPASSVCVWQFGTTLGANGPNLQNILFAQAGSYDASVIVTDVNGCVDSLTQAGYIKVNPKPNPSFDWFPATPSILTNEVTFSDQSFVGSPMTAWDWKFNDSYTTADLDSSHAPNPVHIFNQPGTFDIRLIVTNSYGCIDTINRTLVVDDEFAMYIPNAFTPTRPDGLNDIFNVSGMGFMPETFEMRIFDRWGELVYRTNDIYKGWDGNTKGGVRAKQDVYVYKIYVKDNKHREKIMVGHVTLL